MASTRRWRARRALAAGEALDRRIREQLDATRCQVVDENAVRCAEKALKLGYCARHWGR